MEVPYATNGEVKIYYQVRGSGEPLLLVAGQGSDHHGWDLAIGKLDQEFQVIVFDHRATGRSDTPDDPSMYSTRIFAQDAVAVLDHLCVSRAHVYGASMGGRVAQWLAIDSASRVGGLVLACTTPGNAHGLRRSVDAGTSPTSESPLLDEGTLRELSLWNVTEEWYDSQPEYRSALRRRKVKLASGPTRAFHYGASEGHDSWDWLPMISAPTLVIHGDDDLVNPTGNARLLADRIPNTEIKLFEKGRHEFFVEFRDLVVDTVCKFLRKYPLVDS